MEMRPCSWGHRAVAAWLVVAGALVWADTSHAGVMDLSGNFAVSESGAATYSIPIQVPPGAGGVEPKLALTYNSQAGNGLLGVGWGISGLSVISRCPQTMAQDGVRGGVSLNSNDRFCLDGQRLIVVSGSYGGDGAVYRTEQDSFSKIVSYGTAGSGPAWFKVWTKAGQVIEYGNTADSRIEAIKAPGATATWPSGTVRTWAQNKLSDTKGNYYTVTYTENAANGDYYPLRFSYTGNTGTGVAPGYSVQFGYEDRADVNTIYYAGSVSKNAVRLSNVQTNAGATQVVKYQLAYAFDEKSHDSKISSISQCTPGGACLTALGFTWTAGSSQFDAAQMLQLTNEDMGTDGAYTRILADVNGDGKADIVALLEGPSGMWKYSALSNGDGTFQQAVAQQLYPYSMGAAGAYQLSLADVNGDGKLDVVAVYEGTGGMWVYTALGNGDGSFRQAVAQQVFSQSMGTDGAYTRMVVDVNGDGRADVVALYEGPSGMWKNIALSNGDGTYQQAVQQQVYPYGMGAAGAYQLFLADVNGDGKPDIVAVYEGTSGMWTYTALGNGDGSFRQAVIQQLFYQSMGTDGAYTRIVADVNGDGNADVVALYEGPSGMWKNVALSNGDGSFQPSVEQQLYPYSMGTAGAYDLSLADVNGDGKADVVAAYEGTSGIWVYTALGNGDGSFQPAVEHHPYQASMGPAGAYDLSVADVNGDGKADIVAVYEGRGGMWSCTALATSGTSNWIGTINSIGSQTTSITHKSLTNSATYVKGSGSVYPLQDLQLPMHVVSSISSSNGVGGAVVTNYRYGGLKAEIGAGRGLLGFAWSEATQEETGVVTRTEYRQDWPYVGMPSRVVVSKSGAGNGGVLKETSNTFSCLDPASTSGAACSVAPGKRYFPFVSQSVDKGWDLDGSVLPVVTTKSTYDCGTPPYACYGNAITVSVSNSDGSSKTTTNTYFNDAANWRLGRLLRSVVTSTTP